MSQKIVQRRLQIVIEDSGAQEALNRLTVSANKLEKEIATGTKAGRDMTAQMEKLSNTRQRIEELGNVVSGKFTPSFKQAQSAVSNLKRELDRMSADNPKYAATFDRYRQASQVFDEMKAKVGGFRQATQSVFSSIGSIAAGVGIGNGITFAVQKIVDFGKQALAVNAQVSDQLADIRKAANLTASEVNILNEGLKGIDTRTSTSALRDIAVALGQAGEAATVANVKALDLINVALGDEFGGNAQEIGNILSVLRNNLNDIRTDDFAGDVSKIGNALNELGANGLATAPVVTDIANRIAGVARQFGVSSGAILGTAASFQELGINVERGSTAYVRLLQNMAGNTETFAKVAGVSTKEFANLVNTDINEALLLVAKRSADAAGSNSEFAKILSDLGTEGVGVSELLSKLAANGDLVREKIGLASDALKNTNSIMNEFGLKNETLGAQMEKFGNKITNAFDNSALRDSLSGFLGWLNQLGDGSNKASIEFENTKTQVAGIEGQIDKLLPRYDELTGKTTLSVQEQNELNNIIKAITEQVPSLASAFDKYGNALDINREKLSSYFSENKKLLQSLEYETIESAKKTAENLLEDYLFISESFQVEVKNGNNENAIELKRGMDKMAAELIIIQKQLKKEYGVELPEAIKKAVDEIERKLIGLSSRQKDFKKKLDADFKSIFGVERGTGAKLSAEAEDPLAPPKKTPTTSGKTAGQTEADRRKKELEDLAKELQKVEKELFANTLEPYEKRMLGITDRYQELFNKAGDNLKTRERVLKSLTIEVQQFYNEINKLGDEANLMPPVDEQEIAKRQALSDSLLLGARKEKEAKIAFDKEVEKSRKNLADSTANYEIMGGLKALQKKQEAEKQNYELEKNLAIQEALEKGKSVEEVETQFAEGRLQMENEHFVQRMQKVTEYAQMAVNAFSVISDVFTSIEQGKLAQVDARYRKEMNGLDAMLKAKLITEQDYYFQSQNLEAKASREKAKIQKKEFRRNQLIQIGQALINGAMAVTATLAARPGATDILTLGAFRAINLAIVGAMVASQIAKISSAKQPEFARGGILPNGSSHAQGGIGLYDNRTGRNVGEIEGGEPIISRGVYKANKGVVDALLQKGWAHDNSPLPNWATAPVRGLNVARINRRYFADGGLLPSISDANNDAGAGQAAQGQLAFLLSMLVEKLNTPISVRANVIYGEYQDAGDTLDGIRRVGTIN